MREITDHYVNGSPDPTRVYALDEPDPAAGGACHIYAVLRGELTAPEAKHMLGGFLAAREEMADAPLLGGTMFQHGPVAVAGLNGVQIEHLLAICIDRLRCFQAGPFACGENARALARIEEGLHELRHRTAGRLARGVEGRNET